MGSTSTSTSSINTSSINTSSINTSSTNCFTNKDTNTKNNATTNTNATFTMGMEYEEDIKDEENEEADSAFANNKKHDVDSMRTNTDMESDRSTQISFKKKIIVLSV